MLYKVFFICKRGQGYTVVEANSKEEAIKNADLKKGMTILTVERIG